MKLRDDWVFGDFGRGLYKRCYEICYEIFITDYVDFDTFFGNATGSAIDSATDNATDSATGSAIGNATGNAIDSATDSVLEIGSQIASCFAHPNYMLSELGFVGFTGLIELKTGEECKRSRSSRPNTIHRFNLVIERLLISGTRYAPIGWS